MRRYLKKMKPTDDYVRGYKDAKLMMDESLKKAIEYIKLLEHDVDEMFEAYHDLRPSKVEEVNNDKKNCECMACYDLAMSIDANPCQCFSCDPDGTRYLCTKEEDNAKS